MVLIQIVDPYVEPGYGTAGTALTFFLVVSICAFIALGLSAAVSLIRRAASSGSAQNVARSIQQISADARRRRITSTAGMSTADELEKWVRLRDSGVVSQEEFEFARAELPNEQ